MSDRDSDDALGGCTVKSKIYIVDDHPVVREGLAQFINQEADLLVCGGASDIDTALREIAECQPDAVITDLSFDNESGLKLIEEVRTRFAAIPVLVLSMHDELLHAERCFKAGAHGYIMKKELPQLVLSALREVLAGGFYASRNFNERILRNLISPARGCVDMLDETLSNREREVFHLLRDGLKGREIADRLNLSVKTIETHIAHIKIKLKVKSMRDLLKIAFCADSETRGGRKP